MSSDLAVNAVSVLLAGWVWSQLLQSALEVSPHAPSRRSWLKFLRGTFKQVGLPFLRSAKAPAQPPQDTEKAPEQQSTFPQSVDLAGADLPGFENESHVPQGRPATDHRVMERVTRTVAEGSLKGSDSPGEVVVKRDPEAPHMGCSAPEAPEPEVAEEVTPAPQATLPAIEAAENTGARDAPPSLHEAVGSLQEEWPSSSSTAPPFRFSCVRVQPGDVCRVLGLLMDMQQPGAQQHIAVTAMDAALTGHIGAVGRSESGGRSSDPGEAPPEAKLLTEEVDTGMQLQGDSIVEALRADSDVQEQEDSGEVDPGAEAPGEPLSRPQAEAEGPGSIQTAPADARASWQAEGGQSNAAQLEAQHDAPTGDQQALDADRPQSALQSSTSATSSSAANLVYRIPGKSSMYRPVKKNQTDGSLAAPPVALPSEPADLRAPSDGSRTEGASATASLVARSDPAEASHPTISLAVSGRQDQKKKGVWQKKESSSALLKEAEGVKPNPDSGSGQVSPVAVWQPTLFGGVANSTTLEAFQVPSSASSVSSVGELPTGPRSEKPVQKSSRDLTEAWTQVQQPVSTARWATRPGPQSSTNDVASNTPSERLPEKRQSARWADAWEESLERQESEAPKPGRLAEPASRPQKVSKGWQPSLRPCQDE